MYIPQFFEDKRNDWISLRGNPGIYSTEAAAIKCIKEDDEQFNYTETFKKVKV